MSAHVEIERFITREIIEHAHAQATKAQQMGRQVVARVGMRAANAGDARLLKVLEKGAEHTGKMAEEQYGRTRRAAEVESEKVEVTEHQLWREAYRMMDQGTPLENFQWIYGAAAIVCGYVD